MRDRRRLAPLAAIVPAVAITLLFGSACSNRADGTPTPGTSDDPQHTSDRPSEPATEEAPRVDQPLDAGDLLDRPCVILAQEQLNELGVRGAGVPTTTGAVADSVGPYCSWKTDPALGDSIGVGFVTGNKGGLSDSYRIRKELEYFQPTTIDGYPAVFADRTDRRSDGECNIVVGITDTLTFRAWESGSLSSHEACDRAKQVAAAALATMREGR